MREFIEQYWVETFFGAGIAALGCFYKRLSTRQKANKKEQDAIRIGIQALLRDRIIQEYNVYHAKGEIPIYALESVLDMYLGYHGLGGNGTVSGLIKELKELPKPVG